MATKLLEKKAFKKLCDTFPDDYCTMDLEMRHYSRIVNSENITIEYRCYAAPEGFDSYWGKPSKYPMEAVNDVLKHFDREV